MKNNSLLIYSHPNLNASSLNKKLINSINNRSNIQTIDLYKKYSLVKYGERFADDLLQEDRHKMLDADKIILQFPFYWYSSPSLMKAWIDEVLSFEWAHHGGIDDDTKEYALKGKNLKLVITTGGSEASYNINGYNMRDINAFLTPFLQTAITCKMNFQLEKDVLVLFGNHNRINDQQIKAFLKHYDCFIG